MFELKCLTCIHGEVCAYKHGGVDLSIISGDCKYYKPTADVVPKSEVEKLQAEIEVLKAERNNYQTWYFQAVTEIKGAEGKVAREIISTIKENFEIGYGGVCEFNKLLDNIEKKYTKSEGN